MSPEPARLLVLAGHDPTGGAGVDADREAAQRFGVPVDLVVTAHTEQDGRHVHAVAPRPVDEWLDEAHACARPAVVKTGLLPGSEAVQGVVRLLDELRGGGVDPECVVDPVLAASGGETFLDDAGIEVLLEELVPRGVILTPNVPEAARLTGRAVGDLAGAAEARLEAAERLLERGAAAVLLKGGHGAEDPVRDLVARRDAEPRWLTHPRVAGSSLHGSGCRFASAVAAQRVLGGELAEAADVAGRWVAELIQAAESR